VTSPRTVCVCEISMWTELRSQLLFSQYNNLISRFGELSSHWTRKNRIMWRIHIINAEIYCLNESRYGGYIVLGDEKYIYYTYIIYIYSVDKSQTVQREVSWCPFVELDLLFFPPNRIYYILHMSTYRDVVVAKRLFLAVAYYTLYNTV